MKRRLLSAAPMLIALFVVVGLALALGACGAAGSAEEQAKGRPLPKEPGTLSPGQYHSVKFEPSLSFKVGKGWATDSPEASDFLPLGWELVEAPKNLAGWLQNHPYIETSKTEPVTVGGVKGLQFDVVAKGVPEDHYSLCGKNCVDIFQVSTGNVALFEGEKLHSIVLEDVEGETVYIDHGPDDPEAQKVVDSVKWAGS
jgi:hypothetical protein